jgi:hypothetical protein
MTRNFVRMVSRGSSVRTLGLDDTGVAFVVAHPGRARIRLCTAAVASCRDAIIRLVERRTVRLIVVRFARRSDRRTVPVAELDRAASGPTGQSAQLSGCGYA